MAISAAAAAGASSSGGTAQQRHASHIPPPPSAATLHALGQRCHGGGGSPRMQCGSCQEGRSRRGGRQRSGRGAAAAPRSPLSPRPRLHGHCGRIRLLTVMCCQVRLHGREPEPMLMLTQLRSWQFGGVNKWSWGRGGGVLGQLQPRTSSPQPDSFISSRRDLPRLTCAASRSRGSLASVAPTAANVFVNVTPQKWTTGGSAD